MNDTKQVYIANEELVGFGLHPDMKNMEISNAIRARLNLPARERKVKVSIRTQVIEKLNLDKDMTANDILKKLLNNEIRR